MCSAPRWPPRVTFRVAYLDEFFAWLMGTDGELVSPTGARARLRDRALKPADRHREELMVFRFLYALARVFTLGRAIDLAAQGKPYALGARIGIPLLRKAAQAEEHRTPPPRQRRG